MVDSVFWRNLGNNFKQISNEGDGIYAEWIALKGTANQETWYVKSEVKNDNRILQFEALATIAGDATGGLCKIGRDNWLSAIQKVNVVYDYHKAEGYEGGTLLQVCMKSVDRCGLLEMECQSAEWLRARIPARLQTELSESPREIENAEEISTTASLTSKERLAADRRMVGICSYQLTAFHGRRA